MKREDFIKIIKIRSFWIVGKGDYFLLENSKLSRYIHKLVEEQLNLDNLLIKEDGNLAYGDGGHWNKETHNFDDYKINIHGEQEICSFDEQEKRFEKLVREIVNRGK